MGVNSGHLTTVEAWRVWRRTCAADLCPAAEAAQLREFGRLRFDRHLQRYAFRTGHQGPALRVAETANAWHWFETHAQVSATRAGKRYKDWLFLRAEQHPGDWLSLVESGATLMLRDVVREYLRREHAAGFMQSLHRTLHARDQSGYTLEELLPDPQEPLATLLDRELADAAATLAADFFPSLDAREQIALWVRSRGFSLGDPDVQRWASCGRSVLHDVHARCLARLGAAVKRAHPDEDSACWLQLACRVVEELNRLIACHFSSDKSATRFFQKEQAVLQPEPTV
jgi:hypothetical protein